MNKTTQIFYPSLQKKSSKNGKIPLYMRIIFNKQKSEARLNLMITHEALSSWNKEVMRFDKKYNIYNTELNRLSVEFDKLIADQYSKNSRSQTTHGIRDMLLKPEPLSQEIEVAKYFFNYYQEKILPNPALVSGTKSNYKKAINHFNNFISQKDQPLFFHSLNTQIAMQFKDYLILNNFKKNHCGLSEPYALGIVKKMRTMVDRAIDDGHLTTNPFKRIKLKSKSPVRPKLTIYQINLIKNFDISLYPHLELHRDIFLFSIFTGLSFCDVMLLRKTNIQTLLNKESLLIFSRTKTSIETRMFLNSFAKNIMDKYAGAQECKITNAVLPKRSNKELNINLKLIGNLSKIPFPLSFHLARHAFRQLLSEAEIEDMAVVKVMMGHSRNKDIDSIYYNVTDKSLLANKIKFEQYLQNHLYGK